MARSVRLAIGKRVSDSEKQAEDMKGRLTVAEPEGVRVSRRNLSG